MTSDIARWSLGRWSATINTAAIPWVIVITVVFVLPPNELVLWTMLVVGLLLGGTGERRGPKIPRTGCRCGLRNLWRGIRDDFRTALLAS